MAKGAKFERVICKQLSLWWTYGRNEDVFWRTAGSGSMATNRAKRKKTAFGQHGDVQAIDPQGQSLIDICSIEIKRGYPGHTISDMIDQPLNWDPALYETFIKQAIDGSVNARSLTWWLIVKRDMRLSIIFMPFKFYRLLRSVGIGNINPSFCFNGSLRGGSRLVIFGSTLDSFLKVVYPSHIKKVRDIWLREPIKFECKEPIEDRVKEMQTYLCPNCDGRLEWGGRYYICSKCHYTDYTIC